jgi:hypothetical protein
MPHDKGGRGGVRALGLACMQTSCLPAAATGQSRQEHVAAVLLLCCSLSAFHVCTLYVIAAIIQYCIGAPGCSPCPPCMLAGPSANATLGYDWAIVSVGPPRTASNGRCRTGAAGNGPFNQGGG